MRVGLEIGMSHSTVEGLETPDAIRLLGGAAPALMMSDLVGTMERTARTWLTDFCEGDEQTVGVAVDVERVEPLADAASITATATLTKVEGRAYTFDVVAVNERGDLLARGTHERRLIRRRRYESESPSGA